MIASTKSDQAFIGTPRHCAAKVPYVTWPDGAAVEFLTLEQYVEAH
jgi:hypothetical protein